MLIIIGLSCLLLSSCSYYENLKLRRMVKNNYGKVLDFSWPGYQILEDTILTDFKIDKPITIVSHIYGALCEECFANYLRTAEKYVYSFHSDSVQYVCITYPRPIENVQYAVKLAGVDPSKVMVVYDSEDLYLENNSITQLESGLNAFLIDKQHKVLLLGDPLRLESMYRISKTTIDRMLYESCGGKRDLNINSYHF